MVPLLFVRLHLPDRELELENLNRVRQRQSDTVLKVNPALPCDDVRWPVQQLPDLDTVFFIRRFRYGQINTIG
jgi:hypothetical protein